MSEGMGTQARGPVDADVVVIGGGAAGAIAALVARAAGWSVAVVRRAYGATALTSGAADVAPDPLATPAQPLGARSPILECARALARLVPDHPYASLYEALDSLPEALAFTGAALGEAMRFGAVSEENRVLLTQLGALKATAGALHNQFAGNLLHVKGEVGVVGFRGHPEWDASHWVAGAAEAVRASGLGCSLVPIACDFLDGSDPALRPHEIARKVVEETEGLIASVRRVAPAGITRFLFPPILGASQDASWLDALGDSLGAPCAELPALRLSLPGLRLQQLLDGRLREAGVEVHHGEAFAAEEGRPESLRIRTAAPSPPPPSRFDPGQPPATPAVESWPLRGRAVILATGKFIGGGVSHDHRLLEPVFNLPIWVGGKVDLGSWSGLLTRHELWDEQPLFAAGLRTDASLRPLNSRGEVQAERLFACGDLLAGNDPARHGAGLGLAFFTGYRAGLEASRALEDR